LVYGLLPVGILGIALLFWANIHIATTVATGLVVDQMAGAAETAGRGIPFFIQTGQNLVASIASQSELLAGAHETQVTLLSTSLRTVPFFRQLTFYDARQAPLAGYPADGDALPALRADEKQLLLLAQGGIPQNAVIYPANPADPVDVVFVVPVKEPAGKIVGVLLGRADLSTNPLMRSATSGLSGLANGLSQGFILDDRGVIIYHPDPAQLLSTFAPEASAPQLNTHLAGAQAYQDNAPDGTRRLVLYYPVPGHPWSVVVMVPNYVVLSLAAQISTNVVALLLLVGLVGLIIIVWIAGAVTRPAVMLAQAAQRISEGQLDQPVVVAGQDEIGRAGQSFERMRQKLRARLDELDLLLRVSRAVAGSLNLDDALPPILEGALSQMGAAGARIVLLPNDDQLPADGGAGSQSYTAGAAANVMAPLDRGVLQLTRDEPRVVVLDNLARARTVLDVAAVSGRLQALIALPLRQENRFYGAFWLAYDQPHNFSETETNFLTTLAGQAALAVSNTRLFEAAEQGRQRLAAILASTPDAVVVTDRSERVLLLNPAAEAVFELAGQSSIGRPVGQVLRNPDLAKLLQDRPAAAAAVPGSTGEFEISGRTLFASASNIISADGSVLGRVCVLRDVTRFKELDQMKSEFVATVSHDLRAPLTFMRGYATMLPMVGTLNEKQREFGDKIIGGVQQMTVLIDDLLDLGRIEAGVGLSRGPVRMNTIIAEVVESLLPIAANKGLRLEMDVPAAMPSLSGDATLLRQAVANLVDNAIKYTPAGGQVRLRASMEGGQFRFEVADSGQGIAPTDQTRLFEKFFRVRQRGSTQVKGSGLGLAIVKSIVERHGGRVWVESKLGKGSTFYFSLPAAGGMNGDAKDEAREGMDEGPRRAAKDDVNPN
jgi:PAS domain S-box-containing protein